MKRNLKPFYNFSECRKITFKKITKKYTKNIYYNIYIINSLIFNKNTHLISIFKDLMIWDYPEEFLKRFYNKEEILIRLPKFFDFYVNYLNFFSQPTLNNFNFNEILQDNCEEKAELFYQNNLSKDLTNSVIKIINYNKN